jgi:membrane protease YdiL (CAAX protease family)
VERPRLERLSGLRRWGGWLLIGGAVVAAGGAAGLVASGLPTRALRTLEPGAFAPSELGFALAAALGALVALVGLAVYVVVPGLDPELARRDYDRPSTMLAMLAATVVLGSVLPLPFFYPAVAGGGTLPAPALAAALVGSQAALMIVLIWRVVRPGALTWSDMGLTTEHLGRRMTQGAVGGLIIFVLSVVIAWAMQRLGVEQTQVAQFRGIQGVGPTQFLGLWLLFAVVAPICEEAFFRGYVFGALRGRYGRPVAYVGSALLFALVHLNLPAIVPILTMALVLGFLFDRTRSIVPGIVAHGLNNAVALTLVYGRMVS